MAKEKKVDNFAAFVEKERERIDAARSALLDERAAVDAKIAELDKEMGAITAYERAKTGRATRGGRGGGRRGVRTEVLAEVQKHKSGIKRAKLLEAMKAKGDKSKETSISNALAALKRQGQITLDDSGYRTA